MAPLQDSAATKTVAIENILHCIAHQTFGNGTGERSIELLSQRTSLQLIVSTHNQIDPQDDDSLFCAMSICVVRAGSRGEALGLCNFSWLRYHKCICCNDWSSLRRSIKFSLVQSILRKILLTLLSIMIMSPTQTFLPDLITVLPSPSMAALVAQPRDAPLKAEKMICTYAISGQYSLLSLLLFYALIALAAIGQRWFWPSMAAFAYIINCSATAAFHAFILLISGNTRSVYFDIFEIWAILSVANLTVAPVMFFSAKLRDSAYKPLSRYWGTFVTLGAWCSWFTTSRYDMNSGRGEEPCYGSGGNNATLLTRPAQLLNSGNFDCTYACFAQNQPLRDKVKVQAMPTSRISQSSENLSTYTWTTIITIGLGMFIGLLACFLGGERRRTRRELQEYLVENPVPSYSATYMKSRRRIQADLRRAQMELKTGVYQPIRFGFFYLNIPAAAIVAVLNEIYINFGVAMPMEEQPYSVGQWAQLVTILLALAAAAINNHYKKAWEKLNEEFKEDDEALKREQQLDETDV